MGRFIAWLGSARGALVLLWLIWLIWLAPRALLLLAHVTPSSDAAWYVDRATEMAHGLGYREHGAPTAYWPPGWPLTLTLLFRGFGVSTLVVSLFNLLCGAVSALVMQDLARRIARSALAGNKPRSVLAGRVALLLIALYPNSIFYTPLAMTECFYTALLLGGCWLLVCRTGWAGLVLSGLVFGLAMLVKAQTLVVVPLIFAIRLWREPQALRRLPLLLAQGALVVAVALLTVSPWTLRNQREMGAFVLISTNGGITLLTGNNDSANGDFTPDDPLVHQLDARKDLNEMQFDAEAKRLGVDWIRSHPLGFAKLIPLKLMRLWAPDGEAQWHYERGWAPWSRFAKAGLALRLANQAIYALMLLGMAGFAVVELRRRRREGLRLIDWWLLPYGIAAYVSAIAVVFSGQSRFHFPVMPFAAMTCGWLVAVCADRVLKQKG
ncbi:ArnT family glycosyltransferase [Novosphingobium rosa]|uniref:ArnT family glycosyltransferase n=1 Tax=Novosphingobium rosa TaxID=76978 RepID=UPI001FDEC50F|nr:glycosyltransferase family 39 protein [Novosphingobium rosa]